MAHELAHIKNRDTLTMTITATIAGAISMLAQFGMFFGGGHRDNNNGLGIIGTLLMVILAPIAAMLVQMAISRTREYAADHLGAEITGRPEWLASALGQDRARRPRDPQRRRRAQSGDRASVHRQSALRHAHGQSVLHPSGDREPHRRADGAGAPDGAQRLPERQDGIGLRNCAARPLGRHPCVGGRHPRLGGRHPRVGPVGLSRQAEPTAPARLSTAQKNVHLNGWCESVHHLLSGEE